VYWPESEYHERKIPSGVLEAVTSKAHEHAVRDLDDEDR
jgi:hypothetical protein